MPKPAYEEKKIMVRPTTRGRMGRDSLDSAIQRSLSLFRFLDPGTLFHQKVRAHISSLQIGQNQRLLTSGRFLRTQTTLLSLADVALGYVAALYAPSPSR